MIRSVDRRHRHLRPVRRAGQYGFTLLEVMVAMVVLTLIVTSAFGALRLGERSWEAGHARASQTETMRTVAGVLQRQFNQMLPLRWSVDTEKTIAFSGTTEQVRFIAPAPLHHGSTGLFEYTLVTENADEATRLILYYRLHDPDMNGFAPAGSDSQRVVLVDSLRSVSFAFFGAPTKEDTPAWFFEWRMEAEAFPQLVQARVVTDDDQAWPDLVLALPSGALQ